MICKPFEQVTQAVIALLAKQGYGQTSAQLLAHNCVCALRDGSDRDGLRRVQDYIDSLKSGYVNGDPQPEVEDVAPAFVRVDADNGFAQIALASAFELTVHKAKTCGIAMLAIRNAHHAGSLALDVEPFAEQGLLVLSVVNSIPVVAAPGGACGVYGTNPIAFAAPRANGPPLVVDQSSSTTTYSDVLAAAKSGEPLPEGAGVDRRGEPTRDAQAILSGGALSCFGGYKGASIALLVEVFCAALAGADFSFEVKQSKPAGATTARTGQTFMVIDPGSGAAGLPVFAERVDSLLAALTEAGQSRLPGERRLRERRAATDGLWLKECQWQALLAGAGLEGAAA